MIQIARFVAAIMRAVLAAMVAIPTLVWEAGSWVWRSLRQAAAAPAAAEALEFADEEIPEQAPSDEASPDAEWGRAALAHLCGEPGAAGVLDEAALGYLASLDEEQRGRLATFPTTMIGAHLRCGRRIPSLPAAPTLAEWQADQVRQQAEAAVAAERKLTAREEFDRVREEVFRDLLGDDYEEPALAA